MADDFSAYIKEIGRGKASARSLQRDAAAALFAKMLRGEVPDGPLGAILIALRMKGESPEELRGFYAAADCHVARVFAPASEPLPIVIPSYNGARRQPNLLPLLALMLHDLGLTVLVHGTTADPARVTSSEIFSALGYPPATSLATAQAAFAARRLAFVPIDVLSPALATLLAWRRTLGVRNTAHTLVKLLNPVAGPALRLIGVTHPDYLVLLRDFFAASGEPALLLRGTEGEAVASRRQLPAMDWCTSGHSDRLPPWQEATGSASAPVCALDAAATAAWIRGALRGTGTECAIPQSFLQQAAQILHAADAAPSLADAIARVARRYPQAVAA